MRRRRSSQECEGPDGAAHAGSTDLTPDLRPSRDVLVRVRTGENIFNGSLPGLVIVCWSQETVIKKKKKKPSAPTRGQVFRFVPLSVVSYLSAFWDF